MVADLLNGAVAHLQDLLGDRLGDKKELQAFAERAFDEECFFCRSPAGEEMRIDWQGDLLIGLCCVACWNLRRQLPYDVVKKWSRELKAGERKFCIGEFHESNEERVLVPQLFEDRFSICKQCFTKQLRKRRVDWNDYVKSWQDENSWQNVMASGPPCSKRQ